MRIDGHSRTMLIPDVAPSLRVASLAWYVGIHVDLYRGAIPTCSFCHHVQGDRRRFDNVELLLDS